MLSSNKWLRYVPIRTSKLLFFARFSSTSESYLCLSLTFPHPQCLHYTSRGADCTTSGWASHSHSYAIGCIISTRGSHYLTIGHLFILFYLHIILLEICPFFDTLYSGIGCITWSYLILYFLILIYRHYFLYLILLAIFLFPLLIALLFFWLMWFLLYESDSISLRRYHFLPLFSIAIETLRAMLISVGGRVEEGSFVK